MSNAGKFDATIPSDGQGGASRSYFHVESVHGHAPADAIVVPDAHFLFNADFKRSGLDLILHQDDHELVLHDYFKGDKRPALASPDGAHLTGDIVNALAGSVDVAQAGGPAAAGHVIGHVTKLAGSASVIRNGVSIILNMGDNVEKGDVVQSGSDSTLGITFIDGTVFGLSSNARMVLNEMVYDPDGSNNSSLLSLVAGTITFVAGETAKHGDMKVDTPVATMGIRGTAVLVEIAFTAPGQGTPDAHFQVLVEPDGTTGSYILFDKTTLQPLATVNQAGQQINITNGLVTVTNEPLPPDVQKLINDVFSLKFTSNPQGFHHFTDFGVPPALQPFQLASGNVSVPTIHLNATGQSVGFSQSQGDLFVLLTLKTVDVIPVFDKASFAIADQVRITDSNPSDPTTPYISGTGTILSVTGPSIIPAGVDLIKLLTVDPATGAVSYNPANFAFLPVHQKVVYTIGFDSKVGSNIFHETLNVTIDGVSPVFGGNTATSAGEEGGLVALGATVDGAVSVTITGLAHDLTGFSGGSYNSSSGTWTGTAAEFNALTFHAGEEGTQNLVITATTGAGANSTTENYALTVAPIQENPVFGGNTATSAKEEGGLVTLGATVAPHDADDGAISVTITGLVHDLTGFSGGSYNSSTGTWTGTAAEFNALTFHAGEDGTQNLAITATTGAEGGSTTQHYTLTVTPIQENPVFAGNTATSFGDEGDLVTLGATVAPHDADDGAISVTITGLAHDLTGFSGGSYNSGTGTWTGTAAEFNALTFHAGEEGTRNLVITATTGDGSATENYTLTAAPIQENPVFGGNTATSVGDEGGLVTLGATVAPHDSDDGAVSVTITGLAHDLTGFNGGSYNSGTGTWTGTAAQFNALTFHAGEEGTQNLVITATTEDGSAAENYTLTAAPIRENPVFGGSTATSASEEGGLVTLGATVAPHDADDGAISVTITGLAHDLTGFSGGSYNSGTGTWTGTAAEFNALTFYAGEEGTRTLIITATTGTGSTTENYSLTIQEGHDAPAGVSGEPINLGLADTSLDPGSTATVTIKDAPSDWTINGGVHNADGSWTVETNDVASLTVTTPALFAGAALLNVTESVVLPDGTATAHIISDNVEAYSPGSPIFAWSGDDFLTASSGKDLMVFSQPIGHDTLYDFNASIDQIDLIGFAGLTSFGDIQTHMTDDVFGNAVITLADGQSVTLQGVHAASLTASNFVFDQTPVLNNTGTMTIADGALLPLSGVVNNTGTVTLNSSGGETDLQLIQTGLTLDGGGRLVLSDSDANVISGTSTSVTLDNEDNTIAGAGQLGNGELNLVNAGTIKATGTHALVIDTGTNSVVNSGVLEASGGGGLTIASGITNTGTLWANGADLLVKGELSGNGTAIIAGSGTLDFEAPSVANVIFGSGTGGTLKLGDSFHFNGTISGFEGSDVIDLADVNSGAASVAYLENQAGTGGMLTISNGVQTVELSLLGHYSTENFSLMPDHAKGTFVTYAPHDLVV